MRTDFENIPNGSKVKLFPNGDNPLHKNPVEAIYQSGYFYCNESDPGLGPDYYFRDVAQYCEGFEIIN